MLLLLQWLAGATCIMTDGQHEHYNAGDIRQIAVPLVCGQAIWLAHVCACEHSDHVEQIKGWGLRGWYHSP
jgi:hypothetical protein